MQHSRFRTLAAVAALGLALAPAAQAAITVYEDEESGAKVQIGGRFQLQYLMEDPNDGDSTDDLFFRRLRPEVRAQFNENWSSKFQLDVGQAEDGNEVAVKDAYFQYNGSEAVTLTFGNMNPPGASREFLTSSNETQLVERTFVGNHNYGDLDRALGIKLNGGDALQWGVFGGVASIDPAASRVDFDTPVNHNGDFNDGFTLNGGLDFFPMGEVDFSQGDLEHTDFRVGFRLYGNTWSNDDDNNTYTEDGMSLDEDAADVDEVTAFGGAISLRGGGFSADAEYRQTDAETVVTDFTGGVYQNGETTLDVYSIEGGYAFSERFEIVAGYSSLDADTYADSWNATSVGFNTFFEQHKAKLQVTYEMNENVDGAPGVDVDNIYVQMQYAF